MRNIKITKANDEITNKINIGVKTSNNVGPRSISPDLCDSSN